MSSITLLVLVGLISSVSCACCPNYWVDYGGSCYRYFAQSKEWGDSESYCVSQGAHLVGINSQGENDFISNLLAGPQNTGKGANTWIGLNDIGHENSFVNVDGSSASYSSWHSGEPNDSGTEDCVETNHNSRGKWNDRDCGNTRHFVCEFLSK